MQNAAQELAEMTEVSPRQVEMILAGVDRLPTLPAVATRLLAIGSEEEFDLDEAIALIETDPALSATILALCKTSDKGLGDRITTVRRAVIMLGLETVQAAVLSVYVYEQLEAHAELRDTGIFDRSGFWIHSIAVACAAEQIAKSFPDLGVAPEEAYLGGLLHDVGKLALQLVLPKVYEKTLRLAQSRRCAVCIAEHTTIGIDHYTAGKRLAEHWKLPESIRDAIWLHSQPSPSLPEDAATSLVGVITLAEAIARDLHLGWPCEFGIGLNTIELASEMEINTDKIGPLAPKIVEAVAARSRVLGVGEHTEGDLLLSSVTQANRRLVEINASLQEKASSAARSGTLLSVLGDFYTHTEIEATPDELLSSIVHAMGEMVGAPRITAILQHSTKDPWRVYVFDHGKIVDGPEEVAPPDTGTGIARPGGLAEANAAIMMELSSIKWLTDMLSDVRSAGTPIVMSLDELHAPNANQLPSCLLIMAGTDPMGCNLVSTKAFGYVRRSWVYGLAQAVRVHRSKRLGEELAAANRALASMRDEMAEKESLIRLGQMASGAAHEMNNPLAVIKGRSQQLFERLGAQRDREAAQSIANGADQLSDLITSLHMLSSPPVPMKTPTDPILVVRQAMESARERAKKIGQRAKIQLNIPSEVPPINVDRDLLSSAIAEGMLNAIQANPGGVVTVCIEPVADEDRLIIRISDRGPGFSPRSLKHGFDPFFSEQGAGRRSGLGLARARSILDLHDAEISISNQPASAGGGGEVTITLATINHRRRRAA
ncbi:MAG: HDOD domain-containing protein [Phycisphaerales bacterium]|nr:HDOD domain-containing protein [Phycisphaerales bacterium]